MGHIFILSYMYLLLWFGEHEQLVRKAKMGGEGRGGEA